MSTPIDQIQPESSLPPLANFADFHLDPKILKAVAEQGYPQATPIQSKAIPIVLEGRDVMGAEALTESVGCQGIERDTGAARRATEDEREHCPSTGS